ncbi:hypothetical protein BD560DRAFT_387242 [Blakeslea trispora]|nr:hypothetical protein BD560DRAFT_387242 [Blakeslea trispora]
MFFIQLLSILMFTLLCFVSTCLPLENSYPSCIDLALFSTCFHFELLLFTQDLQLVPSLEQYAKTLTFLSAKSQTVIIFRLF